jgi:hypothetical protein
LILGDAVHNMRAALDLAYVELVTRVGATPSKWTTFRIWESRQKLVDTLSEGILKACPDIVTLLADTVKAYQGGDGILNALDALDISDKHVLLIPVFSVAALLNFDAEITLDGGSTIMMKSCSAAISQDGIVRFVGFPGNGKVEIKNKGQPAIGVLFGKDTGLEGQPVVPTLTQLCQFASGIIQIFEGTITTRESHGGPPK